MTDVIVKVADVKATFLADVSAILILYINIFLRPGRRQDGFW